MPVEVTDVGPEGVSFSLTVQSDMVELAASLNDGFTGDQLIRLVREVDEARGEWPFSIGLVESLLEVLLQYSDETSDELLGKLANSLLAHLHRISSSYE